ncbi:small nuclear ribonucleoprotein G [Encephalitozoon romaleae SJ-2008]|uniref:Small nuclear ribonucleoprotein G n=1 Tax=Encephalitozoon romaleae (strain SJ-2008) TaxID=1178016 RepID=I7AED6_ENCRO|nr:small nuclear ribonucleoprotein G [Encephalitozoon romaleae SJ-2008]AFN83025.1 small nuclear ribonucleoprotein G [Encephalitozoon romaleae SJ-2008]
MGKSAVPNLASLLHKNVIVRVDGGHVLKGLLMGYDAFMNIVLSKITEPSEVGGSAIIRGEFVEDITFVE